MSWPQIIFILKIFKDLFACKVVFDANHHYPEKIPGLFRLQNCLSRNSSLSRKHSKIFRLKFDFDANHHYPEKIQKLFRLQYFLRRKSTITWKYSRNFSPAKLSQPQIFLILIIFKVFFACKNVLAENHQYPGNIQRLFGLQNCLGRKSSLSWKFSKTYSPAKLSSTQIIIILKIFQDFFACKTVLVAIHHFPEKFQRVFLLQICLRSKSSLSWKHSKTFSRANLSYPQIFTILKIFENIFASKIALAANHHYPENIQRFFRLQNCLSRKTSLSWEYSKTFSPAELS